MKKTILAVVLAMAMCFSFVALVACDNTPAAPQIDKAVLSTGVFVEQADSSHYQMVQLNADGTFYAHGMYMQNAYEGKWELVDAEINWVDTGTDGNYDDGVEDTSKNDGKTITKATKAIKFTDADGKASTNVTRGDSDLTKKNVEVGNTDVAENLVAVTVDADGVYKLHHAQIDNATRTLTLKTDAASKEKYKTLTIEICKFMVKELPQWAKDDATIDWKVSDICITVTNKGFTDEVAETPVDGTYEVSSDGLVYNLKSGSAAYGTLTVAADGETASLKVGDSDAIQLVKWSNNVSGVTAMKTLTAEANLGVAVTFTLTFYSNCTFEITNSMGQAPFNCAGEWELNETTHQVAFSDVSLGSLTYALAQNITITWKATLGQAGEKEIVFSFPATELADLQGAEKDEIKLMLTTEEGAILNGAVKVIAKFYSDCAVKVIANKGTAKETVLATGAWKLSTDGGKPSITFDAVSSGTLEYTLGQSITITWKGKVPGAGDTEYTAEMTFASADLAKLQGAEEKVLLTSGEGAVLSGAVKIVAEFYSNGAVKIVANKGTAKETVLETTSWKLDASSGKPVFTFGSESLTFALGASSTFTWNGTIPGAGAVEAVMEVANSDLSKLQ